MSKTADLGKATLLSYATMGVALLASFATTPLIIRSLGQSEYGLYSLVSSVTALFTLFDLGLSSAYVKYFSRYREDGDKNAVATLNGMFLLMFVALALCLLVTGSVLTIFSDGIFGGKLTLLELDQAKKLLLLLTVGSAIRFPSTLFAAYLRVNEKLVVERAVVLLGAITTPLLSLLVLALGFGAVGLSSVIMLSGLGIAAFYVLYSVRRLDFVVSYSGFDSELFGDIARFSLWVFISMIVSQVNWSVDRYLLAKLSGTSAVAVYSVASVFILQYMNISTAISGVFVPLVHQIANREEAAKNLTVLLIKVGRVQFMVLGFFLSSFILFGQPFITWWVGDSYTSSYFIAAIGLAAVTLPITFNLGIEMQQALGMHKFRAMVLLIFAIINILISVPLISRYGGVGAVTGTALSLLSGNVLAMNMYYQKVMRLDMIAFWKNIAGIVPAFLVPGFLGYIYISWVTLDDPLILFSGIAGYAIAYVASAWTLAMNDGERRYLQARLGWLQA